MATIADVQLQVHGVDKRVAVLEATTDAGFKRMEAAIADLRKDLSDQGKTPPPAPIAEAPKTGSWMLKLAPGSGRELAMAIITIASTLGTLGALLTHDDQEQSHVHDAAPRDP